MRDVEERSGVVVAFWLVAGGLFAGSMVFFGMAAVQAPSHDTTTIVSVSDAMVQLYGPRPREGVMTERLRRGEMTERVRTEAFILARRDDR